VRSRLLTGLSLIAVVGGLVSLDLASGGPGGRARKLAPALPSRPLDPPRVTLASLRGEPAAINFWASWCTPCRREAPEIERLHRSPNGPGQVVGVNWTDGLSAARAFVRDHRLTFPNLRDPDGAVGQAYGIVGLPTTVILDSHGRIATVLIGPQTVSTLSEALRSTE
jgi:cytochrome c biogenesis protein CcmG/thiol:disulfide interchange protein DsbE